MSIKQDKKQENWPRAIRDVVLDATVVAVLFAGYEAVFDHYRIVSHWTGTDVGRLVERTAITLRNRWLPPDEELAGRHTPADKSTVDRDATKLPTTIAPPGSVPNDPTEPEDSASKTQQMAPQAPVKPKLTKPRQKPKPIVFAKRVVNHVPLYIATIDLQDPDMFMEMALPRDAAQANTQTETYGDEAFESIIKRHPCAVAINGTFFAKDDQKTVMGNMVSAGNMLKFSQWENYGTTLALKADNEPEMITARLEGQPQWKDAWFSLTCGPRLVTKGEIRLDALAEGFSDSHVLGIGPRSAIGYPSSKDKLYIVSFLRGLSLQEEAKLMKALGCYDAMNLDGGASKALAYNGKIVLKPGRNLTNVLLVYDTKHPAPKQLVQDWHTYQSRHSSDPEWQTASN